MSKINQPLNVMKKIGNTLLSLSAPFLILIACFSVFSRNGNHKLKSLPAFAVGTGLIISGALVRGHRRKQLLFALRNTNQNQDSSSSIK